jgi:hypothetical protein
MFTMNTGGVKAVCGVAGFDIKNWESMWAVYVRSLRTSDCGNKKKRRGTPRLAGETLARAKRALCYMPTYGCQVGACLRALELNFGLAGLRKPWRLRLDPAS